MVEKAAEANRAKHSQDDEFLKKSSQGVDYSYIQFIKSYGIQIYPRHEVKQSHYFYVILEQQSTEAS